jgi:hypothetical protein
VIATLDTNVLISGTVFGGIPGSIIDAAVDRQFALALSPALLSEFENVLCRDKFGLSRAAVEVLVRDLESHALVVHPKKKHHVIVDDPDDNAVIDCAVEAGATFIVSGDGHLTDLRQFEGIAVVTPAVFSEMLASPS